MVEAAKIVVPRTGVPRVSEGLSDSVVSLLGVEQLRPPALAVVELENYRNVLLVEQQSRVVTLSYENWAVTYLQMPWPKLGKAFLRKLAYTMVWSGYQASIRQRLLRCTLDGPQWSIEAEVNTQGRCHLRILLRLWTCWMGASETFRVLSDAMYPTYALQIADSRKLEELPSWSTGSLSESL